MECNKITFSSYKEAQTVVNNAHKHKYIRGKRINKKKSKIPQRVYKCNFCGFYHLTSQPNYYEK